MKNLKQHSIKCNKAVNVSTISSVKARTLIRKQTYDANKEIRERKRENLLEFQSIMPFKIKYVTHLT